MEPVIFFALWAITAFVLFKIISIIGDKRRHSRQAQELGCKPPPKYGHGDLFGIQNTTKIVRAALEKRLPEYHVDRILKTSEKQHRSVTTMQYTLMGKKIIYTADPRNIQAVLATQFKDFELGPVRTENLAPLLGHGIFSSNGEQWAHSRRLLRPQFARDQISDLHFEEKHFQNLLTVLPTHKDGWTDIVNIQPLFFRLTIDTATEFLFGESVESQLKDSLSSHSESKEVPLECDECLFALAFDKVQWQLANSFALGDLWRLAHTISFKKNCRDVHTFVNYYVQLALEKRVHDIQEANWEKEEKYIFLDALASETQDPVELRAQILSILLAGRDTTASLLSWVFLLLAQHPDTFTKLRRVIVEEFGEYSKDTRAITFARLKACSYLQHTLNETLRLFPVVPINARQATRDTTIPVGGGPDGLSPVYVRKGSTVEYSVYAMHRSRELWGDDADEFRPERWSGRKIGWEYLPFNGGPRICIGQQFALTEASYIVVRLLQRFDALDGLSMKDGTRCQEVKLTSAPGESVMLRLREASK